MAEARCEKCRRPRCTAVGGPCRDGECHGGEPCFSLAYERLRKLLKHATSACPGYGPDRINGDDVVQDPCDDCAEIAREVASGT